MKQEPQQKLQQISFIGNFYILFFILGTVFNYEILSAIAGIVFLITISFAVYLSKKPCEKLAKLFSSHPKTTTFLSCTGWVAYLVLPLYVFGFIEGYRMGMAGSSGEPFTPIMPFEYYNYYTMGCSGLFLLSLIYGVYRCLKK